MVGELAVVLGHGAPYLGKDFVPAVAPHPRGFFHLPGQDSSPFLLVISKGRPTGQLGHLHGRLDPDRFGPEALDNLLKALGLRAEEERSRRALG